VAEGARLESVFRGNSNLGSNPSLSASTSGPSPSLCSGSGFRLRAPAALTPAKRLKFESQSLRHHCMEQLLALRSRLVRAKVMDLQSRTHGEAFVWV
jgi:hypothetical protein